jgi:hypothetical protein
VPSWVRIQTRVVWTILSLPLRNPKSTLSTRYFLIFLIGFTHADMRYEFELLEISRGRRNTTPSQAPDTATSDPFCPFLILLILTDIPLSVLMSRTFKRK